MPHSHDQVNVRRPSPTSAPQSILTETTNVPLFDSSQPITEESNGGHHDSKSASVPVNMAEQPTERDLLGVDLLKKFLRIKETKNDVEIVSQSDSKVIRCMQAEDGSAITLVELEAPNLNTKQFRHLFEHFGAESVDLTNECTSSELFCTEDGQKARYETYVQTHKFPLFYERILVFTSYNFFEYQGDPLTHMCLMSSAGNEKFMTKESLGEKLVDGYRVIVDCQINGYMVEPLSATGEGTRLFYVTQSTDPSIPFYLYKRFGAHAVSKIFDRILDKVQTYQV